MSDAPDLDRICQALAAGAPLAPADREALLQGLRLGDVNGALGLDPRAERDRTLREAMAKHFPDLSVHARAGEFSRLWERYAAGPWLRERHLTEPPAHRAGQIEAVFWQCLRMVPYTLGAERLRRL